MCVRVCVYVRLRSSRVWRGRTMGTHVKTIGTQVYRIYRGADGGRPRRKNRAVASRCLGPLSMSFRSAVRATRESSNRQLLGMRICIRQMFLLSRAYYSLVSAFSTRTRLIAPRSFSFLRAPSINEINKSSRFTFIISIQLYITHQLNYYIFIKVMRYRIFIMYFKFHEYVRNSSGIRFVRK